MNNIFIYKTYQDYIHKENNRANGSIERHKSLSNYIDEINLSESFFVVEKERSLYLKNEYLNNIITKNLRDLDSNNLLFSGQDIHIISTYNTPLIRNNIQDKKNITPLYESKRRVISLPLDLVLLDEDFLGFTPMNLRLADRIRDNKLTEDLAKRINVFISLTHEIGHSIIEDYLCKDNPIIMNAKLVPSSEHNLGIKWSSNFIEGFCDTYAIMCFKVIFASNPRLIDECIGVTEKTREDYFKLINKNNSDETSKNIITYSMPSLYDDIKTTSIKEITNNNLLEKCINIARLNANKSISQLYKKHTEIPNEDSLELERLTIVLAQRLKEKRNSKFNIFKAQEAIENLRAIYGSKTISTVETSLKTKP